MIPNITINNESIKMDINKSYTIIVIDKTHPGEHNCNITVCPGKKEADSQYENLKALYQNTDFLGMTYDKTDETVDDFGKTFTIYKEDNLHRYLQIILK